MLLLHSTSFSLGQSAGTCICSGTVWQLHLSMHGCCTTNTVNYLAFQPRKSWNVESSRRWLAHLFHWWAAGSEVSQRFDLSWNRYCATKAHREFMFAKNYTSASTGIDSIPRTRSVIKGHIRRGAFLVHRACKLLVNIDEPMTHGGWEEHLGKLLRSKCRSLHHRFCSDCPCAMKERKRWIEVSNTIQYNIKLILVLNIGRDFCNQTARSQTCDRFVYREVWHSTLSLPCCGDAVHHILSRKSGHFTVWIPAKKWLTSHEYLWMSKLCPRSLMY